MILEMKARCVFMLVSEFIEMLGKYDQGSELYVEQCLPDSPVENFKIKEVVESVEDAYVTLNIEFDE